MDSLLISVTPFWIIFSFDFCNIGSWAFSFVAFSVMGLSQHMILTSPIVIVSFPSDTASSLAATLVSHLVCCFMGGCVPLCSSI